MTLTEVWKGKKTKAGIRILILVICLLCILIVIGLIMRSRDSILAVFHRKDDPYTVNAASETEMETVSILDMLQEAEAQQLSEQSMIETSEDEETAQDPYATSHKESVEPLTNAPVKLSDIYAAPAVNVRLKSYHPLAKSYTWEIYDMQKKDWETLIGKNMTDELYRDVSYVEIATSQNKNDTVMVRCTAELETGEQIADVASVYTVSDISKIAIDGEYVTDCGKWMTSREIPVKVTYEDGGTETITGLEGLVFVEKIESSDISYTDTGNVVETVTTVNTECEYSYIGKEQKELLLRYRNGDKVCDAAMAVAGKDNLAPEITTVNLSDFAVNNSDEPVKVTVSIQAEDNDTPYPYLQYAFIPAGRKLTEKDWVSKNIFERDITQNGTWIAYCRDQSGNISTLEKDIIAVDQKAPELTVRLLNDDWCKSNKIIAEAKDQLSVTYLFSCAETGEESGWIDRNEFEVTKNGTWKVQAKDAAGNISSKDVVISNIDTQMPVIRGITEKEGEDDYDVKQ